MFINLKNQIKINHYHDEFMFRRFVWWRWTLSWTGQKMKKIEDCFQQFVKEHHFVSKSEAYTNWQNACVQGRIVLT